MLRKLLVLSIVCLAVLGGGVATNSAQAGISDNVGLVNPIGKPVAKMTLPEQAKYYQANISKAKHTLAWFKSQKGSWALDGKRYPSAHSLALAAIRFHKRLLKNASRNLKQVQHKMHPALGPTWLINAFICIHGGEGAWNANTGNGYYGGLQMDYGFQSSYGGDLLRSKGTANNWTPAEQIAVAIRAYNSGRGFYPWPNTARSCGLI